MEIVDVQQFPFSFLLFSQPLFLIGQLLPLKSREEDAIGGYEQEQA